MEIKVNEYQLPENISFNFEEMKQELTEKVSMYETMVYTDDQIKVAKEDKANLNKLKKALNDERIKREKEYMQPFNAFKAQINEIISIIDKPIAVIDKQVKEYEENQIQAKMDAIKSYWESVEHPDGLTLEKIFDSKWLNATVTMKAIKTSIDDSIIKFKADMDTLVNLPEYSFEAQQEYISSLDLKKALDEAHRLSEMAKKKAEAERLREEAEAERLKREAEAEKLKREAMEASEPEPAEEFIPPIDVVKGFENIEISEPSENFIPTFDKVPEKEWIVVKAKMSGNEKAALEQYLSSNNIEFKFL